VSAIERTRPGKASAPENFLSRWSRRKLEAARTEPLTGVTSAADPGPAVAAPAVEQGQAPLGEAGADMARAETGPVLPPVESLSFDSDYSAFLKPGVDASVQRAALRKLLHDPRFNVMDGLDVYIDDYTRPSPLDATVARGLAQARYILSPPATRINEQGFVEDVPDDEQDAPAGRQADAAHASSTAPTSDTRPAEGDDAGCHPDRLNDDAGRHPDGGSDEAGRADGSSDAAAQPDASGDGASRSRVALAVPPTDQEPGR
jgi:hypothetical protein